MTAAITKNTTPSGHSPVPKASNPKNQNIDA
jgi:hypothetical protein